MNKQNPKKIVQLDSKQPIKIVLSNSNRYDKQNNMTYSNNVFKPQHNKLYTFCDNQKVQQQCGNSFKNKMKHLTLSQLGSFSEMSSCEQQSSHFNNSNQLTQSLSTVIINQNQLRSFTNKFAQEKFQYEQMIEENKIKYQNLQNKYFEIIKQKQQLQQCLCKVISKNQKKQEDQANKMEQLKEQIYNLRCQNQRLLQNLQQCQVTLCNAKKTICNNNKLITEYKIKETQKKQFEKLDQICYIDKDKIRFLEIENLYLQRQLEIEKQNTISIEQALSQLSKNELQDINKSTIKLQCFETSMTQSSNQWLHSIAF